MALGPQIQNRESLLKQAEVLIDKQIAASETERVTIDIKLLPPRFSRLDWNKLQGKYIAAGWGQATWVSNQRDGDFLEFEV